MDMIEKVDRAIQAARSPELAKRGYVSSNPGDRDIARAAIEAMSEPTPEMKYRMIGEFFVNHSFVDDNDNEHHERIDVPWTTIKNIVKAWTDPESNTAI